MKKYPQLIAAFTLLFSACKKDETTTPATTTPTTTGIKTGTVWTYKHTDYDGQTGTTVVSTSQYTLTIVRDSTINNEKWFIMEKKEGGNSVYDLIKFTADGVYNLKGTQTKMALKFKAAVNDSWEDRNDQTCKVISLNQSVTVQAGTFTNAYYMESNDANSLEDKIWYNEKETLLKHQEYDESPTQPGVMIVDYMDELVSYKE
ncbi:MAG: hypothetical protein J0L80_10775 [Chitinophagales bacterium]|nr:hypothetical protein [Chitinophagales bacterium]